MVGGASEVDGGGGVDVSVGAGAALDVVGAAAEVVGVELLLSPVVLGVAVQVRAAGAAGPAGLVREHQSRGGRLGGVSFGGGHPGAGRGGKDAEQHTE